MKTLRTAMAVALLGLAVTAFESSALAQTRNTTTSSQSSRSNSSSVKRSDKQTVQRTTVTPKKDDKPVKTTTNRPATTISKPSDNKVTRPSSDNKVSRPSTDNKVSRPSSDNKVSRPASDNKVTRPATGSQVTRPSDNKVTRPAPGSNTRPAARPSEPSKPQQQKPAATTRPTRPADKKPGGADVRPGKPVNVRPNHKPDPHRVHPRDRDFLHYSKPSYFWTSHNHCYGHRVKMLPSHALRHVYHGMTYYCYNDIWYRPHAGHYVVCRPPYGTVLAANLIADMAWASIRFSYYNTVAQTYSQINENYEYIAQQNAIIAQNNAIIASQNAQIANGQQQASAASALAAQLGLYQSFAYANSAYYYQDGVFYTVDSNGQYSVIVPPAGALVESLPEDFDVVVLADGNEYYKVDDTVYRVTIVEGKPYFEVLGQMYQ